MTGTIHATKDVKEASISARITRADGTIEELGVISYFSKNPFMMILWQVRRFFGLPQKPAGGW